MAVGVEGVPPAGFTVVSLGYGVADVLALLNVANILDGVHGQHHMVRAVLVEGVVLARRQVVGTVRNRSPVWSYRMADRALYAGSRSAPVSVNTRRPPPTNGAAGFTTSATHPNLPLRNRPGSLYGYFMPISTT